MKLKDLNDTNCFKCNSIYSATSKNIMIKTCTNCKLTFVGIYPSGDIFIYLGSYKIEMYNPIVKSKRNKKRKEIIIKVKDFNDIVNYPACKYFHTKKIFAQQYSIQEFNELTLDYLYSILTNQVFQ